MKSAYNEPVILSRIHNGRDTFLKVSQGEISVSTPWVDAAALAGVCPRTLERWCNGSRGAPPSALALFRIVYLGYLPWPEWTPFRATHSHDNNGARRWLITHTDGLWFTPERFLMVAHWYDHAAELERTIATLRATITALTTRQPTPIPCAEIIPLKFYRDPTN